MTPKEKKVSKVHQIVTDKILKMLEEGVAPWRKPWKSVGGPGDDFMPVNIRTKKPYRGSNIFLLWAFAMDNGFDSRWWGTWKAWEEKGGIIRPEEKKNSGITFVYRPIPIYDDPDAPEDEREIIFFKHFLRYFHTWNLNQVEGVEDPDGEQPKQEDDEEVVVFKPIEAAAKISHDYHILYGGPETNHGGNRAFYRPSEDFVKVPQPEQFDPPEEYYSTEFHELVHSTGHETRLDRKEGMENIMFGSHAYSKEELIAEFGAAILCAMSDIEQATIENSASYIAGWSEKLQDNPTWFIQAGAKAHAAVDHILGVKYE